MGKSKGVYIVVDENYLECYEKFKNLEKAKESALNDPEPGNIAVVVKVIGRTTLGKPGWEDV